jgi:hypothetical protein
MQLASLLEEAQGAAPDRRILLRDQIAPFGKRAIEGVEPWLASGVLAAFAVRVILRVGQQGEREAAAKVLRSARRRVPTQVQGDVDWALAALRLAARQAAAAEKALATPAVTPSSALVRPVQPYYSPVARRRRR